MSEPGKFIGPLTEESLKEAVKPFEGLYYRSDIANELAREKIGREMAQISLEEIRKKYEKLRIDKTSGLLSKDEMDEQAEQKLLSFEHGRRRGDRYNSAVLLKFDAVGFKLINDTFGHPEGDRRIGIIGSFLKKNARLDEGDLIGRLGKGDEFGWLVVFDAVKTDAATVLYGIEARIMDIEQDQFSDMPKLRWNHAFYNTGDSWEDLLSRADMKGDAKDRTRSHDQTQQENKQALERALLYS